MGKVIGDFAGAMTTILTLIGDQLGLFKDLAANGAPTATGSPSAPASTSATREWLHGLTPPAISFARTAASRSRPSTSSRSPRRAGPCSARWLRGVLRGPRRGPAADRIVQDRRRRAAKRVPRAFLNGLRRATAGWHENHLVQEDPPCRRCRRGSSALRYADVGCGRARDHPARCIGPTFVGYDALPAGRRGGAGRSGGRCRPRGRCPRRGREGPGRDVRRRPTFDVIHDAVDPGAPGDSLRARRRRALPAAGHQLRRRPGRQPGSARGTVLRVQRHVLHDDVARQPGRGPVPAASLRPRPAS